MSRAVWARPRVTVAERRRAELEVPGKALSAKQEIRMKRIVLRSVSGRRQQSKGPKLSKGVGTVCVAVRVLQWVAGGMCCACRQCAMRALVLW